MTQTGLRVASDLLLPLDFVTQTAAILARRGAGKTYCGKVLAEELISAGLPVVVLDPVGVWWGLRSSADGKRAGLPVTILGGDHGDLPLEAGAGKLVAGLVADDPSAIVLDLSALPSKNAQRQFATDFAEHLYRVKASNRAPLHVMIDEADEFAPQRVPAGDQRQLGAFETLVRRGRARGIGVTMITQRPAVLNKNVLTQIECLIVMQITSPQDRKALGEWVSGHAEPGEQKIVEDSLAVLRQGEGWFWSPAWLGALQRVQIRHARTFDSSATPKAGEVRREANVLASVDLDRLKEGMDRIVKEAEAKDPKRLQGRIRELERDLAARPKAETETIEVRVEVPVTPDWVEPLIAGALADVDESLRIMGAFRDTVLLLLARAEEEPVAPKPAPVRRAPVAAVARPIPSPRTGDSDIQLKAGARRILDTLARHYPQRVTKAQLGTLAKFKITGGTFLTYWSTLKRYGLVDERDGLIQLTDAGMDYVGHVPAVPLTTDEVLSQWHSVLKAGARKMLDVLVAVYPASLPRSALADRVEMESTGGTFNTYLGTLRRNGLIDVEGQDVSASESLFLG